MPTVSPFPRQAELGDVSLSLPGAESDGRRLVVTNLLKSYSSAGEKVSVLRGVDLSVLAGEFVCVLGSSGSGKSTLLNVAAGLDRPDAGSVWLVDREITHLSDASRAALRLRSVGMVFQDHNLVPDFTVSENIELVLLAAGESSKTARMLAQEAMDSLGVGGLLHRFPRELSGGQAQRVGIARAIAGKRAIIFADEPTGALDNQNSILLFELLRDLIDQTGISVVMCTHDLAAKDFATRVHKIEDGRLVS